jgi:hypothetical protein
VAIVSDANFPPPSVYRRASLGRLHIRRLLEENFAIMRLAEVRAVSSADLHYAPYRPIRAYLTLCRSRQRPLVAQSRHSP